MQFKADLHIHTRFSGDNEADPEEMVEQAIGLGLDALAFTEHYSYRASEFAESLREKYSSRITIFRGVEISSMQGHILVFGLDTDALALGGSPAEEVVERVTAMGGIAIPSHPYRRGSGIGDMVMMLEGLVALEGYNGCNLHSMNMMAIKAAGSLGLPVIGGSDAHAPREVGSCYTEFEGRVDENTLVEALRGKNYSGRDTRKISRMTLPII